MLPISEVRDFLDIASIDGNHATKENIGVRERAGRKTDPAMEISCIHDKHRCSWRGYTWFTANFDDSDGDSDALAFGIAKRECFEILKYLSLHPNQSLYEKCTVSRNRARCLFCGEVLALIKPHQGKVAPLGPVPFERIPASTRIVVTCPKCGEKREFDCRPKDVLKPAA